ncbi:MAG: hypothetical protein A3I29_03760 [Candidatus Magasanikbacteria bacterium RIFCSPLOWO2_02_FULL_44_11]|uniref:Nif3-like dinuclear metal center hexameric protein n=1 Tax=Candidatus Magasanikbacteria bacterium RIFCSPLOWO2_02_FULL_44_11 TaxID=1798689 RepID=A0A1F6NAN0_9BACT|nr:MAG: hypothetical protein A3I29_03760 [Candidatus Magasanikbacteria bacterium RIFCSPLOWO2_02_FULL_44_11]
MNMLQKNFDKAIIKFLGVNNAKFEFSGFIYKNKKKEAIDSIGLTLDISIESVKKSLENGIDTLVCFHAPDKLGGKDFITKEIKKLIKNKLNLYKCHLPLNFADFIGIHSVLCMMADLKAEPITFKYEGRKIRGGEYRILEQHTLRELLDKLKKVGSPYARIFNHEDNNKVYKNILISSGSGFKKELFEQTNCDLIISGEAKHSVIMQARDNGVTLVELGHYYTENAPLSIIAKKFEEIIGVSVKFISIPFLEKIHDFK